MITLGNPAHLVGANQSPAELLRQRLSVSARRVADGFQPSPPHRRGCPVIMKLDPEHVAWTCGRCGAIATTEDLAVRPALAPGMIGRARSKGS